MKSPIRILSDLHLGHKVSRIDEVRALRPLIAGAGTVIFNGDTWQELAAPFYDRAKDMLEELRGLCREEGVAVEFLPGNHDPGWQGKGWIELLDGRIVIAHGDTVLFDGSPWKREILLNADRILELWDEHPQAATDPVVRQELARAISRELCTLEHSTGRHLLQRVWDAIHPPQRALKMLEAWFGQATQAAALCDRYFPKAEFLILGHFHRHGCWREGGRTIINTGSFVPPGKAHWVEYHDGWLSRGVIDETPDAIRKGETLDVWRLEEVPGAK